MSILFLFVFVIGVSFLCSLLEAVLLSITPAYVSLKLKEKRKTGALLEHLIENLNRPLSAVLTLNTLSHTMGSAAIAYQVHHQFGEESVTVASFILTFLILIVSEILPKTIGANNWKALAPFTAYVAQILIILLYPMVVFSEWTNRSFVRKDVEPEITRDEMIATAEIGAEEGTLKTKESAMIKNLLMLDKVFVSDIMTPRSVFFALESDMTVEEVFNKYRPIRFSRIPVYHDNLDHVIGMTYRHKIHDAVSNDLHDKKINELVSPIQTVSERLTVYQALDFFIKEKEHLALVTDEYGIITGLVTLEDAVETLLGVEIVDELDSVEDMRKYALEQWQIRKKQIRRS